MLCKFMLHFFHVKIFYETELLYGQGELYYLLPLNEPGMCEHSKSLFILAHI